MNRHHPITTSQAPGATLTEVLMSMMILSIGVLSVASLFPIGILSSARATQLTHAALLRQNAEAVLSMNPNLIHDPDGDGNYLEHNGTIFAVDQLGWVRVSRADKPQTRQIYANFVQNPQPMPSMSGVACIWGNRPPSRISASFKYGIRRFHGFEESDKNGFSPYLNFAHVGNPPQQRPIRPEPVTRTEAEALVGSRDDWLELVRTPAKFNQIAPNQFQLVIDPPIDLASIRQQWHAEDVNNNGILDTGEDLNSNGIIDGIPTRVSLIDPDGRHSQVRVIPFDGAIVPNASGGGGTIGPLVFDAAATSRITEVVIEAQDTKYSWMLTVRKPPFSHGGLAATHPGSAAPASVDLIVFFKRPFGRDNEEFYPVVSTTGADGKPGVANFDDDGRGGIDDANEFFWSDSDDRFSLKVSWNNESEDTNNNGQLDQGEDANNNGIIDKGPQRPVIRPGKFVFDLQHGQWYRVQSIVSESITPGNSTIEFTVNRPLSDPLVITSGAMMFPKGIIAVFPLGTK